MAQNVNREDLAKQLETLIADLKPEDQGPTLSTLKKIFDNVSQDPHNEKYRQIKIANKRFNNTVWKYPAGEKLMKMSGWTVEGDHVRLNNDFHIQTLSEILSCHVPDMHVQLKPITGTKDHVAPPCYDLPLGYEDEMTKALFDGEVLKLRGLLEQVKIPANRILIHEEPLLDVALAFRRIGIARILIKEYSLEINDTHIHKFLKNGALETEAMDLITEFNVNINDIELILFALQCRCFEIIKYAIEKCHFNVNFVMRHPNDDKSYSTLLHFTYMLNQQDFAEYLIEKGADKHATDMQGLKPSEYRGGFEPFLKMSEHYLNLRLINKNFHCEESLHYLKLTAEGYSEEEAVSRVLKLYPSLKSHKPAKRNLDDIPKMNELNLYTVDIASFYIELGLKLNVPNENLLVIKKDSFLPSLTDKCKRMLELWLEMDTTATWNKLCEALKQLEKNSLAVKIEADISAS